MCKAAFPLLRHNRAKERRRREKAEEKVIATVAVVMTSVHALDFNRYTLTGSD